MNRFSTVDLVENILGKKTACLISAESLNFPPRHSTALSRRKDCVQKERKVSKFSHSAPIALGPRSAVHAHGPHFSRRAVFARVSPRHSRAPLRQAVRRRGTLFVLFYKNQLLQLCSVFFFLFRRIKSSFYCIFTVL